MLSILQAAIFTIVFILLFCFFGLFNKRLFHGEKFSIGYMVLVGFMLYYSLFQLLCLPMILTQQALSRVSVVWMICILAVVVLAIVYIVKNRSAFMFPEIPKAREIPAYVYIVVGIIILQIVLVACFAHNDGDDAYYTANITTSVYTDTMFRYDPYTGTALSALNIRYALATYTMSNALFCQVFQIHPLLLTKTILPVVFILVTNLIYLEIARELFGNNKKAIIIFLGFASLLNLFGLYSIYTSSTFMMTRTSQGKSMLANIVIPMIFLVFIKIWRGREEKSNWWILLLTIFTGAAVTSTSFFVVPVVCAAFAVPMAIVRKNGKIVRNTLLAGLPLIVTVVIYLLFIKGIWSINF